MKLEKYHTDLAKLACKDDTCTNLCCVRVEQDELVVTNGHYLLTVARFPKDYETDGLDGVSLDAKLFEEASKIAKGSGVELKKSADGAETNGVIKVSVPKAESQIYPDYEQVFPDDDTDSVCFAVNPDYLLQILTFFKKHGANGEAVLVTRYVDKRERADGAGLLPIKITGKLKDSRTACALIMPMRL